jgi:23S rRNA pseudouridine1911/1915/1917 synthase
MPNASPATVPESLAGERLDKVVVTLFRLSRAQVKRAIDSGGVRVVRDGKRVRLAKGATVAAGDVVHVEGAPSGGEGAAAVPEPEAALVVRFESPAVIVVDKPAGQASAPLRPGEHGTLANALVGHFPELAGVGYGPREPGIVHRLDTETSGLVVVARTAKAFEALRGALKNDRIEKEYLAICSERDLPDEGSIDFPIANHPKDTRRVHPCVHPRDVARYQPRAASTRYRVERRVGAWALVRVACARALRHQIRAHFAAIGHPLAGDALYGGPEVPGLGRHALHASRVAFDGGGSEELAFDVESLLPEDMAGVLSA